MSNMFSPEELHWLSVIERDEKLLDELTDKRDIQIAKKFIDFMKLMLKYENLRLGGNMEVHKRLIRIHKNISTKMLEFKKYEYIIFNGLYVVADVIFIDADIVKEYYETPTKEKLISLGVPENVISNSVKLISTHNKEIGVALVRSEFTDAYIQYPSHWSYPIW